MATLAADKWRKFESQEPTSLNELPVIASDIIYKGAFVGDNGSGLARPLVAGDPFMGVCEQQCDNSAGAASALNVKVREQGRLEMAVTGASSAADVNEIVYASDDDTLTLTAGSNTPIGKVARWVTGTTCVVQFLAFQRMPHDIDS